MNLNFEDQIKQAAIDAIDEAFQSVVIGDGASIAEIKAFANSLVEDITMTVDGLYDAHLKQHAPEPQVPNILQEQA